MGVCLLMTHYCFISFNRVELIPWWDAWRWTILAAITIVSRCDVCVTQNIRDAPHEKDLNANDVPVARLIFSGMLLQPCDCFSLFVGNYLSNNNY